MPRELKAVFCLELGDGMPKEHAGLLVFIQVEIPAHREQLGLVDPSK